jgi:uncharacterized membrane protein
MFDKTDILARLQKGESIDTIADEMAEALNAAEAEYNKVVEETNRVEKLKEQAASTIMQGLVDYFVAIDREDLVDKAKTLDIAIVLDLLKQSVEFATAVGNLQNLRFDLKLPEVEVNSVERAAGVDEILSKWIKSL